MNLVAKPIKKRLSLKLWNETYGKIFNFFEMSIALKPNREKKSLKLWNEPYGKIPNL
jgi:hypothetical protein